MLSIKTRYLYCQRIYLNQLSELRQSIKGQEMDEQLKSKALEIIMVIIYTCKALFISIAPKVWLLMKLADMVSGK